MKIDAVAVGGDFGTFGPQARRFEAVGYDGLYTVEGRHDPFLPLVLAAEHTERMDLATSIAVAFPRSPTHLAQIGHDLQRFSKGRFILGLGSQIRAHIEKRFSAQFSQPAARMRELIMAIRAVWKTWEEGEPLRFEGDFYRLTLMTPFFNPGKTGYGPPRVFLAAVGERMTEVAGEVCDGMFGLGFTTEKYLRETTMPAIERGLAKSGRSRSDIELSLPTFVVTGATDEEWQEVDAAVRKQIAFYGSTPAYRPVLEAHGWGDLQDELNAMSKRGAWEAMQTVITDDILDAFAVRGSASALPGLLLGRYGDLVDRVAFPASYRTDSSPTDPNRTDPEKWADVVSAFKAFKKG